MPDPSPRDIARRYYANALRARGFGWRNAAGLIETGFENCWITPALDAIESLVLLSRYDEEGDEG